MKWNRRDVPHPEADLSRLVVRVLLELFLPQAIITDPWIGFVM